MKIKSKTTFAIVGALCVSAILAYCLVSYGRDQWDFHNWDTYIRFGEIRHHKVSGLKCFVMSFFYFIVPTSIFPILIYNDEKHVWW